MSALDLHDADGLLENVATDDDIALLDAMAESARRRATAITSLLAAVSFRTQSGAGTLPSVTATFATLSAAQGAHDALTWLAQPVHPSKIKSAMRRTTLDVEAQPWPGIAAPVECRLYIDYVDEDDWVVEVVDLPVEITRDGPFEMPRPRVRLTGAHPLGAGIIAWTMREPGVVEISDHVRDCLDDLAADPRGSD